MGEIVEFVEGQKIFDVVEIFISNVGHKEMLVGGQSEATLVNFRDFAQPGLEFASGFILNPTIFNEECEVVFPVFSGGPPEVVNISVKSVWSAWR